MATDDPIGDIAHDHADLNRRVLELKGLLGGRGANREPALVTLMRELRENLFLHFAREEEGLFPFVSEHVPDLADQVQAMAIAHDAICGAVARMVHLASADAKPPTLVPVFERFQAAYASHAKTEAELLRNLRGRLDADQRTQLALLVRGL
jgi:hypothetical protein